MTDTTRLSRFQRIALRAMLLIQFAHTLMWLILDTLMRLMYPLPVMRHTPGVGWVTDYLPWQERLHWLQLFYWCVALIVELILWRSISRLKRWAWPCMAILLIDASLYLLWVVGMGFDVWPFRILEICLLVATPIGFTALWLSRRAFRATLMLFLQIAPAIILASIVVFIKGRYFPTGSIQWAVTVPVYVDAICSSGFSFPQEGSLLVCWGCYAVFAALFWGSGKIRMRIRR